MADQRVLHDYFDPTLVRSEQEALAHRRSVTAAHPGLPQRAGKALKRFQMVKARQLEYVPPVHVSAARARQRGHAITVRAVLKPHPDMRALARAMLSLTPEQIDKLRAGRSARDD